MRTDLWSVGLVVWCFAAPASAQLVLSEADALARLSPESPRVRAILAAVDIARADVLAASRWPNPKVTFDRESVAGITEDMTMVAQPLPVTGRRGLERRAANALLQAATNRTGDELRRARADLRLAFADLVVAQTRERELTRARDHLRELTEILAKRETAGEAAGFDRLRAEREVMDGEADLLAATSDRARAQAAVASFFPPGTDPSTVVAADTVRGTPVIPPVDLLIERALASRGELLALGQEVEAARLSERAAARRAVPEPEIVAGTKSSNVAGGHVGSVFSVQAVIPLFDRGKAERAQALARATQAQARADALRRALRSQIAGLRAAAVDRRAAAERYRGSAVKTTQDLERIAQVSYDAGERGILELLDVYRTGTAARVRQALLDAAARQIEIELEFLSGWELPS
jgi:cobalt-zinc-cadmium efflux system outer membrane protein